MVLLLVAARARERPRPLPDQRDLRARGLQPGLGHLDAGPELPARPRDARVRAGDHLQPRVLRGARARRVDRLPALPPDHGFRAGLARGRLRVRVLALHAEPAARRAAARADRARARDGPARAPARGGLDVGPPLRARAHGGVHGADPHLDRDPRHVRAVRRPRAAGRLRDVRRPARAPAPDRADGGGSARRHGGARLPAARERAVRRANAPGAGAHELPDGPALVRRAGPARGGRSRAGSTWASPRGRAAPPTSGSRCSWCWRCSHGRAGTSAVRDSPSPRSSSRRWPRSGRRCTWPATTPGSPCRGPRWTACRCSATPSRCGSRPSPSWRRA